MESNSEKIHRSDYRYPGSRPFSDSRHDRTLFFGRDEEIQYLYHSILVENLFVLFGKSGLGKTSLINAGVMEPLREKNYAPMTIRFNNRSLSPVETLYSGIESAVQLRNEFADLNEKIDYEPGDTDNLWTFFETSRFWSADDHPQIPVLVLDQFEEFFVMHDEESRKEFIRQLADLVMGRVPRRPRDERMSKRAPDERFSSTPPPVKILISIREDYLGYLQEMSKSMPGILRNRFRLLPLKCRQARAAIVEPARLEMESANGGIRFSYSDAAVKELVTFLCERIEGGKIIQSHEAEPFQLQLLCQHIEEMARKKFILQKTAYEVQPKDLGGKKGMERVLQQFYEKRIETLNPMWRRKVRKLCEKGLIENRHRMSLAKVHIKKNYNVPGHVLNRLVNNRLLRSDPRVGDIYYELSHDTFVEPILKSNQERKVKRLQWGVPLLAFSMLLFVFFAGGELKRRNTIDRLYQEAHELRDRGRDWEAIVKYKQILDIEPRKSAYLEIGKLKAKESPEDAVELYEDAIANNVHHESIFFELGKLYAGYEKDPIKHEKAAAYFEKAIRINPNNAEFHVALGDLFYNSLNKTEVAMEYYEKALDLDKDNTDAYKRVLLFYIDQELYDDAIDIYGRTMSPGKQYESIIRDIYKNADKKQLREFYQLAQETAHPEEMFYEKLGFDFFYRQDYPKALESYRKALAINPDNPHIYAEIATIYMIDGKPEKALTIYRNAVEVNPGYAQLYREISKNIDKSKMRDEILSLYNIAEQLGQDFDFFKQLGDDFQKIRSYGRAAQCYDRALLLGDKHPSTFIDLALSYFRANQPEKIIRTYKRAIEAGDRYCSIFNEITAELRYHLHRKGIKEILMEIYRLASQIERQDAAYYTTVGEGFYSRGNCKRASEMHKKSLELNKNEGKVHLSLALAYICLEKFQKALEVYRDAIKENENFCFLYKRIEWELKRKNVDKKFRNKLYRTASNVDIKNPNYFLELGKKFESIQNYSEAGNIYKKILKTNPRSPLLYKKMALNFIKINRPENVIDVYIEAIEKNPKFSSLIFQIGGALKKNKMTGTFEKLKEITSTIKSLDESIYTALGTAFHYLREYTEAVRYFKKSLALNANQLHVYRNLIYSFIKLKNPHRAFDIYRRAVEFNPEFAHIIVGISREMKSNGMPAQLEPLYRKAIHLDINNALYYEKLALSFRQLDEWENSVECNEKALTLNPHSIESLYYKGIAKTREEKYKEAIDILTQALMLIEPEDDRAHSKKIYIQLGIAFRKNKQYRNAIKYYEEARKLDPWDAKTYNKLGVAWGRLKKFRKAKGCYKRALNIDPRLFYTHLNLAEILLVTGDFDEAQLTAKKLLKNSKIYYHYRIGMRFISIAAHFLMGNENNAKKELTEFFTFYNKLPKNALEKCEFNVFKTYLSQQTILKPSVSLLLEDLLAVVEDDDKNGHQKLNALKTKHINMFSQRTR